MKRNRTKPEQILKLWESKFQTLGSKYRREFLEHPITGQLCKFQIHQIEAAIDLGHAQYLPQILKEAKFYSKRSRQDLFEKINAPKTESIKEWKAKVKLVDFVAERPELAPNPFAAKYDKYICSNRVTHGRRDECRCLVAA